VADSLAWRRFCRIPLGCRVPHPTTLMKITTRCGQAAVDELNEALVAKAHEHKLVRLGKIRADTTVVEANVDYPTAWPAPCSPNNTTNGPSSAAA
jgi:IS5 family transposase